MQALAQSSTGLLSKSVPQLAHTPPPQAAWLTELPHHAPSPALQLGHGATPSSNYHSPAEAHREACSPVAGVAAASGNAAAQQLGRQLAEHSLQLPCWMDPSHLAAGEAVGACGAAPQQQEEVPAPLIEPAAELQSGAVRCGGAAWLHASAPAPEAVSHQPWGISSDRASFRGLSLSLSPDTLLASEGASAALAAAPDREQLWHTSARMGSGWQEPRPVVAAHSQTGALHVQSWHSLEAAAQLRTSMDAPQAWAQAQHQSRHPDGLLGVRAFLGKPVDAAASSAADDLSLHSAFLGRALGSRETDPEAAAAAGALLASASRPANAVIISGLTACSVLCQ